MIKASPIFYVLDQLRGLTLRLESDMDHEEE